MMRGFLLINQGTSDGRLKPISLLKYPAERRVRARGLQNFLRHHGPGRPGALTGRILQQAVREMAAL